MTAAACSEELRRVSSSGSTSRSDNREDRFGCERVWKEERFVPPFRSIENAPKFFVYRQTRKRCRQHLIDDQVAGDGRTGTQH